MLLGLGLVWQLWLKPKPMLPADIRQQLNFVTYLPKTGNLVKLDKSTIKYDKQSAVLSMVATYQNNQVTITEQAYPDVLIYDRLIGTLKQYDEVQTKTGKVALTRPDAAGGSQVAVVSADNKTLVFVKTSKDLTKDEWLQFFNTLDATD